MSIVSDRLRRRQLCPETSAVTTDRRRLCSLQRGQRATVTGYDTSVDASAVRRLFDLGLAPGIEVEMVRRAPLRDPVIYRVGDYEIALRRDQSRAIFTSRAR